MGWAMGVSVAGGDDVIGAIVTGLQAPAKDGWGRLDRWGIKLQSWVVLLTRGRAVAQLPRVLAGTGAA